MRDLKKMNIANIPKSVQTIENIYIKFLQTGTVLDLPKAGRRSISQEQDEEIVAFTNDGEIQSCREISRAFGVSKTFIHKLLKINPKMTPYKL